jgi:HEAT repeat protein
MKLLSSPLFGLLSVAVLIAVGIGAVVIFIRRGDPDFGAGASDSVDQPAFGDYVKNPDLLKELEEAHGQVGDEIDAASRWNDEQVAAAVRRYVLDAESSRESWTDARILEALGSRTHPALLQILRDRSLHTKLVAPTGKNILPEAPFNRICDLLDDDPPVEAVALLVPFLQQSFSSEIRKSAALTIGSTGAEAIVVPMRTALRDDDEYVRSYALMGLQRAIEAERLSDVCARELFEEIQRTLAESESDDDAAWLLLYFDEQRAVEFFLSDAVFTPKAKSLDEVLHALNAKGLTIPREKLLGLIEQLGADELKYPHTYQLSESLQALGKHQVPEDRAILERYLSHGEDVVAEGAAVGMLASHGLDGFEERIWKAADEQGVAALSLPQRYYIAVVALDGQVNNGGFSQYFFNSSGDGWRTALAGLEAMESSERLAILRDAVARFPDARPPENREQRMEQLAKLESAKDGVFDDLDSRYYESVEVVGVMQMRYVLKNADAFK